MSIRFATQAQIQALRDACIKVNKAVQPYQQGSYNPEFIDSDVNVAADALISDLNDAVDDVIAAAGEDSTPSAFSFTDVTDADTSTVYTSNSITVAGLDANSPVAISVTGGQYSINDGDFTSDAGTVVADDTVRARGTSSGSAATAVNVAVTIGGVSDTFTITTAA